MPSRSTSSKGSAKPKRTAKKKGKAKNGKKSLAENYMSLEARVVRKGDETPDPSTEESSEDSNDVPGFITSETPEDTRMQDGEDMQDDEPRKAAESTPPAASTAEALLALQSPAGHRAGGNVSPSRKRKSPEPPSDPTTASSSSSSSSPIDLTKTEDAGTESPLKRLKITKDDAGSSSTSMDTAQDLRQMTIPEIMASKATGASDYKRDSKEKPSGVPMTDINNPDKDEKQAPATSNQVTCALCEITPVKEAGQKCSDCLEHVMRRTEANARQKLLEASKKEARKAKKKSKAPVRYSDSEHEEQEWTPEDEHSDTSDEDEKARKSEKDKTKGSSSSQASSSKVASSNNASAKPKQRTLAKGSSVGVVIKSKAGSQPNTTAARPKTIHEALQKEKYFGEKGFRVQVMSGPEEWIAYCCNHPVRQNNGKYGPCEKPAYLNEERQVFQCNGGGWPRVRHETKVADTVIAPAYFTIQDCNEPDPEHKDHFVREMRAGLAEDLLFSSGLLDKALQAPLLAKDPDAIAKANEAFMKLPVFNCAVTFGNSGNAAVPIYLTTEDSVRSR